MDGFRYISECRPNDGGVYAIRNKLDFKMYVGSTNSFKRRMAKHLGDLGKGNHHSILLQRAWNKYGQEMFEMIELEPVTDESVLLKRE